MIEFFAGFVIGIISVYSVKIAGWIQKKDEHFFNELETNNFDYNEIEKSLEDILNIPNEPEHHLKPEGTE